MVKVLMHLLDFLNLKGCRLGLNQGSRQELEEIHQGMAHTTATVIHIGAHPMGGGMATIGDTQDHPMGNQEPHPCQEEIHQEGVEEDMMVVQEHQALDLATDTNMLHLSREDHFNLDRH